MDGQDVLPQAPFWRSLAIPSRLAPASDGDPGDSSDGGDLNSHGFSSEDAPSPAHRTFRSPSRQQPRGRRGRWTTSTHSHSMHASTDSIVPTGAISTPLETCSSRSLPPSSENTRQSPALHTESAVSGSIMPNTPHRSNLNPQAREFESVYGLDGSTRDASPFTSAVSLPPGSHPQPGQGSNEDQGRQWSRIVGRFTTRRSNSTPYRPRGGRGPFSRSFPSSRDSAQTAGSNDTIGPLRLSRDTEKRLPQFSVTCETSSQDTQNGREYEPLFGPASPRTLGGRSAAKKGELVDNLIQLSNPDEEWTDLSQPLRHSNRYATGEANTWSRVKPAKRPREKSESNLMDEKALLKTLDKQGAVSMMLYHFEHAKTDANDVWPNIRDATKLPARYWRMNRDHVDSEDDQKASNAPSHRESFRPSKIMKLKVQSPRLTLGNTVWPAGALPTEMFEEVAKYVSRDDIKTMRLVCREFDRHISQVLFHTVVVPFNTEIYGMLDAEPKVDIKGMKKVKIETSKNLPWKNANGNDVYDGHGLDVFKGFGPHIRRYGMSFDVNEDALTKPPAKDLTESHTSFWGVYQWPFVEYRRFEDVAGLELAADETPKMKIAFSMLEKVQELALSVDSGLGWLNGSDKSLRARILQKSPSIFGSFIDVPDRKTQAQKELWEHIKSSHVKTDSDVKLATLYRMETSRIPSLANTDYHNNLAEVQPQVPFADPHLIGEAIPHDSPDSQIPSFEDTESLERFVETQIPSKIGVLYTSNSVPSDFAIARNSLVPSMLTNAQKEWLLETEWAQRAFLSSYMLAVMDNPATFANVHTFNISRLSSRFILALHRNDFWDALPSLNTVNILVVPDWRTVMKDEAGFVETPRISPPDAINPFYQLLSNVMKDRANITRLNIGWAAGGEYAEGLHARNRHLLPAPLLCTWDALKIDQSDLLNGQMLSLPHVQELKLSNCWVTPPALLALVSLHDSLRLECLTLDSVSLTAMPRQPANQNHGNHALAAALMQAGALGAVPPNQLQAGGNQNQAAVVGQNQIQFLQAQLQHLQTQPGAQAAAHAVQIQAHLQTLLQFQGFMQNNQNNQIGAAMNQAFAAQQQPPPQTPQAAVRLEPRQGSWPYILDITSPGQNLKDFGSTYSNADNNRQTNLKTIELVSCGYARLPHAAIEQLPLEGGNTHIRIPQLMKRYNALASSMMSVKDPLIGEIVQEVDATEVSALSTAWFLTTGWADVDDAAAVEFDGLQPGGTGRFSGVIRVSDRQTVASPPT